MPSPPPAQIPWRAALLCNGAYDIVCALSILFLYKAHGWRGFFSRLHVQVLGRRRDQCNPVLRRMLAYWILTYGCARLLCAVAGWHRGGGRVCATVTYIVEGGAWAWEARQGSARPVRAVCVTLACLVMAVGIGLS